MKKLLLTACMLLPTFWAVAGTTMTTRVGDVDVDGMGKTLYTFSKDSSGTSVCEGACLKKWPPYLQTETNSDLMKEQGFNTITRSDGRQQWAKDGMPLYRWFKDQKSGDILGAGIKGVWRLSRADDVTLKLYNNGMSLLLVDAKNLTLYTFDKDQKDQSNCYGGCEAKWPPAYVSSTLTRGGVDNLHLTGGFGIIKRKDGTYQWTYHHQPLYRWFRDSKAGDTHGNNVKNVWHIITL